MDNIKKLYDWSQLRIQENIIYLRSKFHVKLMMISNNHKGDLYQKEIDIINTNIEVYFKKYQELIFGFMTDTNTEISYITNDIEKMDTIIEKNLIIYLKWATEHSLFTSEISTNDLKEFDSFYIHGVDEKRNVCSAIIKLHFIDEIERILSWLCYYFYIHVRYLKFHQTTTTQNKTNLTGFNSSLADEAIQTLFEQLKGNYIDKNTNPDHFKAIFNDEPLPDGFNYVEWIELPVLLSYFIYQLKKQKIIKSPNHWKIARNVFNTKSSLRQLADGFQNSKTGKPKGYEKIDTILKNIYAPLQ